LRHSVQRKDPEIHRRGTEGAEKKQDNLSNSAIVSLLADLAEHLPLSFSQVDRTATAAYIWATWKRRALYRAARLDEDAIVAQAT
jgi:hypothetical protein